MADTRKPVTNICGYNTDSINVRGKDLVADLMGKASFIEMMILQALGSMPAQAQVQIVDAVLVTIMEHGLTPSAIVTRMTHHGAPESFQGAVAAGLLGVGDRYAGTAGECGEILERIVAAPGSKREETAREEVRAYRKLRRPIPGFGHPIHTGQDPRVERLLEIAADLGVEGHYIAALKLLETCLNQEGKKLVMNVSAVIAAVLGEAGIPAKLMRGIVLTARCAGLAGHLFEEMRHPVAPSMWEGAGSRVEYETGG